MEALRAKEASLAIPVKTAAAVVAAGAIPKMPEDMRGEALAVLVQEGAAVYQTPILYLAAEVELGTMAAALFFCTLEGT